MTNPRNAYILLTRDCNLRCAYCFQGVSRSNARNARATTAVIDAFVAFCQRTGVTHAELFGGEPLLYADTFAYAVKSIRAGLPQASIGVVTNGTLINEKIMTLLEAEPVDMLISVDGDRDTHDRMRGRFDDIKPWFPRLTKRGRTTVALQAGRVGGLYDNVKYLWDSGFRKGVFINLIYNYGWYSSRDTKAFRNEYETLVLGMLRGEGTLMCALRLYGTLRSSRGFQECGIISEGLACDWNGDLYPCIRAVELGPDFAIGTARYGIDPERERAVRGAVRKGVYSSPSLAHFPLVSYCPVAVYQQHLSFGGEWAKEYCQMLSAKAETVAKYYHEIGRYLIGAS